ncbi:MAG: DNA-directed RNA polymerase subunit alpha [Bacillota bacterium]
MIEFEKPTFECLEEDENNKYAKFSVKPLERGYGTTIGNSLRRIMLSSLPGAAVKWIKVDDVLHEYSSIPGVKEDVVDIILNLKNLAAKIVSDEDEKILRIEMSEPGEITAGDIITDIDVEILNTDLHVATLEENASLNMEIGLTKGRGYVSAEDNKDPNFPIGVIPVDSLYTPVSKVNYKVNNTRVGQKDDYDELVLEVWTDGSLNPQEAISLSAEVLTSHLDMFVNLNDQINNVEIVEEEEEEEEDEVFDMTIEELDLSVRSYNCLKRAGLNTVSDLISKTEEELMSIRNLGKKSLKEIKQKLIKYELSLKIKRD